jgi:hypothetical protein
MIDDYTIPADLTIPWFMNCKNQDVQAERELAREIPLIPAMRLETKVRDLDAETQAYIENERIKKENSLAKLKERKAIESNTRSGSRYDSRNNRWLTPEEDFAGMARQAKMTVEELRTVFVKASQLPDMPTYTVVRHGQTVIVDLNKECCRAFARRILANLDNAALAREAEKAMTRARRINNRNAKANIGKRAA